MTAIFLFLQWLGGVHMRLILPALAYAAYCMFFGGHWAIALVSAVLLWASGLAFTFLGSLGLARLGTSD